MMPLPCVLSYHPRYAAPRTTSHYVIIYCRVMAWKMQTLRKAKQRGASQTKDLYQQPFTPHCHDWYYQTRLVKMCEVYSDNRDSLDLYTNFHDLCFILVMLFQARLTEHTAVL